MFRGTPPPKPLKCKSVSIRLGARLRPAWAHHTGGTPLRSCASIRLALSDIIKTSLCYRSQIGHLSLPPFHRPFQGTRNPAHFAVSRVGERNSSSIFRTCLHQVYPNYLRDVAQWLPGIVPGQTHHPGYTGYDVSLSRPSASANSWLICSCKFSSNVPDEYHGSMVTVHLYFVGMIHSKFKYPHWLIQGVSPPIARNVCARYPRSESSRPASEVIRRFQRTRVALRVPQQFMDAQEITVVVFWRLPL